MFHEAKNAAAHPVLLKRQYHCSAYRTSHQQKTDWIQIRRTRTVAFTVTEIIPYIILDIK